MIPHCVFNYRLVSEVAETETVLTPKKDNKICMFIPGSSLTAPIKLTADWEWVDPWQPIFVSLNIGDVPGKLTQSRF